MEGLPQDLKRDPMSVGLPNSLVTRPEEKLAEDCQYFFKLIMCFGKYK